MTEAEKAAMEATAKAAGMSVSDYVRGSVLAVNAANVQAAVIEAEVPPYSTADPRDRPRVNSERTVAAALRHRPLSALEAAATQADATGMPTTPMFFCPLAPSRCSFAAPSAAARCPVHGRKVVES